MTDVSITFMRWQARRYLSRLRDDVVEAGLPALATIPGLAAMVDQHAAAVRDRVATGLEASAAQERLVLLASYAGGLLESARGQGWTWPTPGDDSPRAVDWTSLRLMAICALAETREVGLPDLPPLGGQERYAA